MKKVGYLFGFLGLLIPFGVNALTGDVTVTCDKSKLLKGETTTCTVKGNIDEGVNSLSAEVDLGDNLTFLGFTPADFWQGDGDNGNIDLYYDENMNDFDIGTITVKAGDESGVSTSVGLKNVKLYDEDYGEHDMSVTPFDVRVLSDVNTLKDINSIDGFSSTITDYELNVTTYQNSIFIDPELSDDSAELSGDIGTKPLSYGVNNFKITVKSESGVSRDYNLKVVRPDYRELTGLSINNNAIELKNGVYEYNFQVENDITKVEIGAEFTSEIIEGYLRFADEFGPRVIDDLKVGNNEVLIKVVDGYGEELVYKINVNRLDENGNDVSVKDNNQMSDAVSNPKTGVSGVNFIVLILCAVSYLVIRKKNLFKKI